MNPPSGQQPIPYPAHARAAPVNPPLIVALGAVTGLFLGMVCVFLRKSLDGANGIENPEATEKMLGAGVLYATIPHGHSQQDLDKRNRDDLHNVPLLAVIAAQDAAIESLRAFRAALQFSIKQSKNTSSC